jgi:flagellar biosynthesis protein FlhF
VARDLIDRLSHATTVSDLDGSLDIKTRAARLIESEIRCAGPLTPSAGRQQVVALVGPTGVGKTTTIAKLAAHFHLRERHRVGLVTIDTYRMAAVDQLRTYADIIELPMEVVSTSREMRAALERMAQLDLVLIDTAGRSPRDELRIHELKSLLAEAETTEVMLVLSSVSSTNSLVRAAQRFADLGVTSLLLTKLDEATGLGSLLTLFRHCGVPLRYVTNGQNVPDDIAPADGRRLARIVLGLDVAKW